MFDAIKNAIQPDAHLYEIDKEKLKTIYDVPKKRKFQYEIVERKIIFANDNKGLQSSIHSKEEIEKNYFSNYKFFREYLTTGFESEETKTEISEIKNLIENSKTIRENLMKHLNLGKETTDVSSNNYESRGSRKSSGILQKSKFLNNFAKMCKLLTIKNKETQPENSSVFKLYSELDNPSDIYSFSVNENFLSNKFLNFKKKLTQSYYKEEFFTNFAKNYHPSSSGDINLKSSISSKNLTENLSPEIRVKIPVDYIDSIFRPRESEAFFNIDSFMSNYGTSHKAHLNEKDLYENVYGILSKCNHANFLSFLYSKNDLFKFIYDEFAKRKGNFDQDTLQHVNLSRIDSIVTETDKYFRGPDFMISPKDSKGLQYNKGDFGQGQNLGDKIFKGRSTLKNNKDLLEESFGCHFVDKISFLSEKIDEKICEVLLDINGNQNISKENFTQLPGDSPNSIQNQSVKGSIINLLKSLLSREFNFILLLSKNEKLKVSLYSDDREDQLNFNNQFVNPSQTNIEEDFRKIQFYKIDQKYILDRFPGLVASLIKDSLFREVFTISNSFFILEIKNYKRSKDDIQSNNLNLNSNTYQKFSLSDSTSVFTSQFYLLRINNENIERFEFALKYLELYKKTEDRAAKIKSNSQLDDNSNLMSNDEKNVFKNSIQDQEKKIKPRERFSKYDEDFLGIGNDDILKEVLQAKNSKEINMKNKINSDFAKNPNLEEEENNQNFDFRNLIDKEQKKIRKESSPSNKTGSQMNTLNLNSSPDTNFLNTPQINFKENFMFRIDNIDHKFSFSEKNGQMFLVYYKYNNDEDEIIRLKNSFNNSNNDSNSSVKKKFISLNEIRDYQILNSQEGKDYHKATIKLRFLENNKSPLEIISYVKGDYLKFITKIEKYVKKATY
jgi:hypothetical protein